MTPEEEESVAREQARCDARAAQLRSLEGDPVRREALDEAWAPLLRGGMIPTPDCRMPYDAPELLP